MAVSAKIPPLIAARLTPRLRECRPPVARLLDGRAQSSLPLSLHMKKPPELSPLPPASRRTRLLLAGVGSLAVSTLAGTGHADIYKQVGADGVISFTSSPAHGSKLVAADHKPPVFMPSDDSPERFSRYDEHIRQ